MTIKHHTDETPAADRTEELRSLADSELDRVAGGIVSKRSDAASANLFAKCANGKHYDTVQI